MRWLGLAVVTLVLFLVYFMESSDTGVVMLSADYVEGTHEPSTTRILFTGDVFLGRDVERRNRETPERPLNFLRTFPTMDAVVINFEATVPAVHVPTPDFGMQFSVKADFIPVLASAGVTHASLANNHALDHESSGLRHTRATFREHAIETFGHPTDLTTESISYIESANHTVAVVGVHTLFTRPTEKAVNTVFSEANAKADVVVAYVHWGEEYELEHELAEERLARSLIAAGADLIIGHHPHVVQGIHVLEGVPVIYSLGNTIFDQYFSRDVQEGLVVELALDQTNHSIVLHPITSMGTPTVPRRMVQEERTEWLQALAARSDPNLSAVLLDAIPLNSTLAE